MASRKADIHRFAIGPSPCLVPRNQPISQGYHMIPELVLSTSNASSFMYQPLSTEGREIRLLHLLPGDKQGDIRCALQTVQLDDCHEYCALSYTWGDGQLARNVTINSDIFPVTENLYGALRQLRNGLVQNPWFWVDAICIDQASIEERNNQVPLMTEIYRKARATCVWLGEEFENSNLAMDLASWLFEEEEKTEERFQAIVDDPAYERYFRSLYHLFCRPYFRRMWVVQEMLAAKKTLTFCGSRAAVFMTHLLQIAHLIMRHLDKRKFPHRENLLLSEIERVQPVQSLYHDMVANIAADYIQSLIGGSGSHPQKPLELVMKYRKQLCKDSRDKIYGLFGLMAHDHERKLTVDYSLNLVQVYTGFAEYVVSTSGKLNIICLAFGVMGSDVFPSWVPDWRHEDQIGSQFLPRPNIPYSAARASKAITRFSQENRVLTAKGLVICSIDNIAENVGQNVVETTELGLVFRQWLRLALNSYGRQNPSGVEKTRILDLFWRTVIFDRAINGTKAPDSMRPSFDSLCVRCGITTSPDISVGTEEVSFKNFVGDNPDEYTTLVVLSLAQRKFFTLTSGLVSIGIAPSTARAGDLLCLLLGCDFPMILRKTNDHYILIGEAYVHGCMTGEAFPESPFDDPRLQDFEIR